MTESVSALAGPASAIVPAKSPAQPGASPDGASAPPKAPAQPEAAAPATRLLIEPNGAQGYVYRLVEAATGRVLVELPRSQLDQLKSHPAYTSGAIASRSA
jgi:hypothetical protein